MRKYSRHGSEDHEDSHEDPGPSGRGSADDVGIGASRRHSIIRPKDCAGSIVWAKLAKYPWYGLLAFVYFDYVANE